MTMFRAKSTLMLFRRYGSTTAKNASMVRTAAAATAVGNQSTGIAVAGSSARGHLQQQQQCHQSRRWMTAAAATSRQKRALDEKQLKGDGGSNTAKAPSGGSSSTPPPTSQTPPSAPPASGGAGGSTLPLAVAGLAVVAGAFYYFNVMQAPSTSETDEPKAEEKKETKVEPVAESKSRGLPEQSAEEKVGGPSEAGNKVVSIAMPSKMRNMSGASDVPAPPEHPAAGNRVSMMPASATVPVDDGAATKADDIADDKMTKKAVAEISEEGMTDEAAEELLKSHQTLWTAMDDSFFKDLDQLNNAQLKARVVQLATEMKDRTKWEAVRLKEFLAMKEKETSDKFMDLMQKQRHEFEDLLAKRLREQEHALKVQMRGALQAKDDAIQSVVESSAEALKAEHEREKAAFEQTRSAEIRSQLEEEFGQNLEQYKAAVGKDMEKKVSVLEKLTETVKGLESALSASQTTQKGSVKAHRLSAAALALSEKLSTSDGAAKELQALKVAAGKDGVIATAVATVPSGAVEKGVPTLAELQDRFEEVHTMSRRAALVPEGRPGLEGQLAGMAFAALKYAPNPDDPAPETDKDNAEYVLARAQRHVQKGELEPAVEQLEKLRGQPAMTAADWKKDALNRIAVEKALKVIKMECALLNESLAE